jgi:quercetin dioxygenase-like cupin family protein
MVIIRTDELVGVETPGGNRTSGIATPRHGAREVSVIRQVQQPNGQNPPHYHDRDETVVLTSGRLRATVGDETAELNPGDALLILAGVVHQFANADDRPAEWLIISALPLRFFRPDGEEHFPEWAR